jgi:hypothetical protein
MSLLTLLLLIDTWRESQICTKNIQIDAQQYKDGRYPTVYIVSMKQMQP